MPRPASTSPQPKYLHVPQVTSDVAVIVFTVAAFPPSFFFARIMTAISLQFLRYFPHNSRLQFICTEIKIVLAELANF